MCAKPPSSAPSRLSVGIHASSKNSSDVSESGWPKSARLLDSLVHLHGGPARYAGSGPS